MVTVIDDDENVRQALRGLFRSVGLDVSAFGSIQEFLESGRLDAPGCMILDIRLPGRSGLDFQKELAEAGNSLPIIFISGHADVATSVRAMKAGAFEFLTKPIREQELLEAVQLAIEHDRVRREGGYALLQVREVFSTLTRRERDIMALVVLGRRNKQIAAELGVTEATVKLHRGHVMEKMRAGSVADLVRLAAVLGFLVPGAKTSTKV